MHITITIPYVIPYNFYQFISNPTPTSLTCKVLFISALTTNEVQCKDIIPLSYSVLDNR